MSFSPFDGVLLDDPREPVPGSHAVLLHLRVEQQRAQADRRPQLSAAAVLERGRACRDLLAQGLLPGPLRELGLPMGRPADPGGLGSLLAHFEDYLAAVDASGFLEPMAALWEAARAEEDGKRGFWVERGPEDGPLDAGLEALAPPRLRALLALPGLGPVRFRLATHRGRGVRGLFEDSGPHLVRDLLPSFEALAARVDRFDLEAPEGWGENPWGAALDSLLEGPLALDAAGKQGLRRALLPTPGAVLEAAVEQICTWVREGIAPGDITLIHPEAEALAPLMKGLLESEGLGLDRVPGVSLSQGRGWAPLLALLEGLVSGDPGRLATGLLAFRTEGLEGEAIHGLADRLLGSDEVGAAALQRAFAGLSGLHRSTLGHRWTALEGFASQSRPFSEWPDRLEKLALGWGVAEPGGDFHAALGLLGESWRTSALKAAPAELLEVLRAFLDAALTAPRHREGGGIRLVQPSALLRPWAGSRATLVLDLGEGAWPAPERLPPDLDESRRALINAALRKQPAVGDFPPALQTFRLSRSEGDEFLPRAYHVDAFAFNTALALTRERFVALSSATDADGNRRGQGIFWKALDGAGTWLPDAGRAASRLRYRAARLDPPLLEGARQQVMRVEDPDGLPGLRARSADADAVGDWWQEGRDADHPVSPTRLEQLARCPFRVLAERGLGLDPWPPGPAIAMGTGSALHGLLEALLTPFSGLDAWPEAFREHHGLPAPDSAALEPVIRQAWEGQRRRIMGRLDLPLHDAEQVERGVEDLLPDLGEWLAWDLAQTQPLPEERAGLGLTGEGPWNRRLEGLEQCVGPVALLHPPRWFRGRVDRLEHWRCGDEAFLRALDYKGSRPGVLKGHADHDGFTTTHLQLPLYQRMLEAERGLPVSAWLVPLRGFVKPLPALFAADDEAGRTRLSEHASALLARAEQGSFPPVPGTACGACSLAALCNRPVDLEALDPDGDQDADP